MVVVEKDADAFINFLREIWESCSAKVGFDGCLKRADIVGRVLHLAGLKTDTITALEILDHFNEAAGEEGASGPGLILGALKPTVREAYLVCDFLARKTQSRAHKWPGGFIGDAGIDADWKNLMKLKNVDFQRKWSHIIDIVVGVYDEEEEGEWIEPQDEEGIQAVLDNFYADAEKRSVYSKVDLVGPVIKDLLTHYPDRGLGPALILKCPWDFDEKGRLAGRIYRVEEPFALEVLSFARMFMGYNAETGCSATGQNCMDFFDGLEMPEWGQFVGPFLNPKIWPDAMPCPFWQILDEQLIPKADDYTEDDDDYAPEYKKLRRPEQIVEAVKSIIKVGRKNIDERRLMDLFQFIDKEEWADACLRAFGASTQNGDVAFKVELMQLFKLDAAQVAVIIGKRAQYQNWSDSTKRPFPFEFYQWLPKLDDPSTLAKFAAAAEVDDFEDDPVAVLQERRPRQVLRWLLADVRPLVTAKHEDSTTAGSSWATFVSDVLSKFHQCLMGSETRYFRRCTFYKFGRMVGVPKSSEDDEDGGNKELPTKITVGGIDISDIHSLFELPRTEKDVLDLFYGLVWEEIPKELVKEAADLEAGRKPNVLSVGAKREIMTRLQTSRKLLL